MVLRPGGINALFDISAQEFRNQVIQLNDVVALDTSALREQLIDASAPQVKFQLLESFLITQLNKNFCSNPGILRAAKLAKDQNGIKTVSEIADVIGYSRRQLSKLFNKIVGVTPKQYARIQRFQQVLHQIPADNEPDWTRIALECGYFDQPHFNRDFKALSGLTPTDYFRNKTDEVNHLPA